jgi:hypothetical protein
MTTTHAPTDTENGALLRLTTFNAKRGFWDNRNGAPDLDSVMTHLDQAPLPDILGFSEATNFHLDGKRALYRLAARLTEATGDRFEPFLSECCETCTATAAPPATASEPPSQKSFCTSTTISALAMADLSTGKSSGWRARRARASAPPTAH